MIGTSEFVPSDMSDVLRKLMHTFAARHRYVCANDKERASRFLRYYETFQTNMQYTRDLCFVLLSGTASAHGCFIFSPFSLSSPGRPIIPLWYFDVIDTVQYLDKAGGRRRPAPSRPVALRVAQPSVVQSPQVRHVEAQKRTPLSFFSPLITSGHPSIPFSRPLVPVASGAGAGPVTCLQAGKGQ